MKNMIKPHHQQVIDRLTAHFENDPRYVALIIAGSVAAGRARDESDVDIFLVATEEEWARCQATHDYFYYTEELSDYPGGYVDGKVVDLSFLCDTAEFGSEPLRAAFQGAFITYSHLPELAGVLERIPVYPEHDRRAKIETFYSQVVVTSGYITPEYEARNGSYVVSQAAAHLAHYGARLLLAHNRILFPGWKWLTTVLTAAPEKPAECMTLFNALLQQPNQDTATAFHDAIVNYRDWGVTFPQAIAHFIEDVEWHWRQGNPYPYNW